VDQEVRDLDAGNFADACRRAGVRQIVYLGGPEPPPGDRASAGAA